MSKLLIRTLCLVILAACPVATAVAAELILDFEDMFDIDCGDTWLMSGITIMMWDLSHCQSLTTPYGWGAARTCIEFDLTPLDGLRVIELSFLNYREPGTVYAQILDDVLPVATIFCVDTFNPEIMQIDTADLDVSRLRVFCSYFIFYSVTLRYGSVANEGAAWGEVKALYR